MELPAVKPTLTVAGYNIIEEEGTVPFVVCCGGRYFSLLPDLHYCCGQGKWVVNDTEKIQGHKRAPSPSSMCDSVPEWYLIIIIGW